MSFIHEGTSDFYIDETTTITASMMTMPLAQQLSVISSASVHKTSVSEYSVDAWSTLCEGRLMHATTEAIQAAKGDVIGAFKRGICVKLKQHPPGTGQDHDLPHN